MRIDTNPDSLVIGYLRSAYRFAWVNSDDKETKNGAVIVSGRQISIGCNRLPKGVKRSTERLSGPEKYNYMEHAERDVIFNRTGITDGGTMYCPWAACTDCAKAIINSGIIRVVGHKAMYDKTTERWRPQMDISLKMFAEAGVEYVLVDSKIGDVKSLFRGEIWHP